MNPQEIIADLRKQDVEILTEERLNKVVNEVAKPVTYIGLEPSNVIHIGNLSASIPVFKLAKHGFKAIILLRSSCPSERQGRDCRNSAVR